MVDCVQCGAADGDKKCGKCRQVSYCSKECQLAHWKTHKHECVPREGSKGASGRTSSASTNGEKAFDLPPKLSSKGHSLWSWVKPVIEAPCEACMVAVGKTKYNQMTSPTTGPIPAASVSNEIFADLITFYFEVMVTGAVFQAIRVLKRFMSFHVTLKHPENFMLVKWLMEAGRVIIGHAQLMEAAAGDETSQASRPVSPEATELRLEAELFLRRGLEIYDQASSNLVSNPRGTRGAPPPNARRGLLANLRTNLAFSLRHKAGFEAEAEGQCQDVTCMEGPPGVPLPMLSQAKALAYLMLSDRYCSKGDEINMKSSLTSAIALFGSANCPLAVKAVKALIDDEHRGPSAARAIRAELNRQEADFVITTPIGEGDVLSKEPFSNSTNPNNRGRPNAASQPKQPAPAVAAKAAAAKPAAVSPAQVKPSPAQPAQAQQTRVNMEPVVAVAKLMEAGQVDEALAAAKPARQHILSLPITGQTTQAMVHLSIMELDARIKRQEWKAAFAVCGQLQNFADQCKDKLPPQLFDRVQMTWRQFKSDVFRKQRKISEALALLDESIPFTIRAYGGSDVRQMAALMGDAIGLRLDLHISGKEDQLDKLQEYINIGIAALEVTKAAVSDDADNAAKERWGSEVHLRQWLHMWNQLKRLEDEGVKMDQAEAFFGPIVEASGGMQVNGPMAAWEQAEHVLQPQKPMLARLLDLETTSILFAGAAFIPAAVGIFLVLYALRLV